MTGTEQHSPPLVLTDAQRERLAQWRAWWEEGEQRFAHWELEDRDRETAEAFRALLEDAGFTFSSGADLTTAQLDRLCALARRLAPNSSLDRRLYHEAADRTAFNRALRDLLYGAAALPERIAAFLALRGVGAQTASQLLCAAEPDRFPLVSTASAAALKALGITPEQREVVQAAADAEYGLTDRPPRDPARRLLGEFALLAAVRTACVAERDVSYLALHRLLQIAPGALPVGRSARGHTERWPAVGRAAHAAYTVREERTAYQPLRSAALVDDVELAEVEGDERALLAALEAFVGARGFTYPPLLLRDYYVALKTRPFAILSGVSGTGKTRLTRLFAEFFADVNAVSAPRYLLLPVRPDWTDPTALLGYFNLLAAPDGRYVSTPFLDFLGSAGQGDNARHAWFVCLDEMNLGRVEHYFADALAALEAPDRSVPLHGAPDGATLRLPPNLFITGTVNVDEASHALSRRVLDRANTLTLGEVDLGAFGAAAAAGGAPDAGEARGFEALFLQRRVRDVSEARARLDALDAGLVGQAIRLLTEVNDALAESGLGFGYRVRDEALMYLANSFDVDGTGLLAEDPEDLAANAAIALDLQVAQRVLPRLSGTEEQIGGAMRTLLELLAPETARDGDTGARRRAGRSRYPRSAERLLRLAARLRREGYATFYEA